MWFDFAYNAFCHFLKIHFYVVKLIILFFYGFWVWVIVRNVTKASNLAFNEYVWFHFLYLNFWHIGVYTSVQCEAWIQLNFLWNCSQLSWELLSDNDLSGQCTWNEYSGGRKLQLHWVKMKNGKSRANKLEIAKVWVLGKERRVGEPGIIQGQKTSHVHTHTHPAWPYASLEPFTTLDN